MARTKTPTTTATRISDVTARFAKLTEQAVRNQTDEGSYSRGRSYWRQGRIHDTVLRGDEIEALCDGSDFAPYRVTAMLATTAKGGGNPRTISCSCPRGGFCKHVVAMLLTWIHDPNQFVPRATLADVLAERSQQELITLIEQMVERHPELERLLDLPLPPSSDTRGAPNEITVDERSVRKMVRTALNEFDPYNRGGAGWGDSWGYHVQPPPELRTVADLGQRYAEIGQWANAVVVFSSLVGEIFEEADENLFSYDEEGRVVGIINDADNGLAAALEAQASLPEDERLDAEVRGRLIRTIYDIWQYEVFQAGGIGLCDGGTEVLVEQVTADERALVERWLREEQAGKWGPSAITGLLVDLREAAGASDEEILAIYRDAKQWNDAAAMLVSMDRLDDAVTMVRQHIRHAHQLIDIANVMLAHGSEAGRRAIELVDDFAWEVEGDNEQQDVVLKNWLIARYGQHGRPQDALKLSEAQFRKQPSLHAWLEVQKVAELPGQPEGTWDTLRPELIEVIRAKEMWPLLVDIYLAEGEVAAALEAFDRNGERIGYQTGAGWQYFAGEQDLRLAQAAERDFPERALPIYRRRALRAIEMRNRDSYRMAAKELRLVKKILTRLDRSNEWTPLITEIRETNKRLRALQDELNKAGLA